MATIYYAVGSNKIYRETEAGQPELIAELPTHPGLGQGEVSGLALASDGRLFAMQTLPSSGTLNKLWEIDVQTGATTFVYGDAGPFYRGMEFDSDGNLLLAVEGLTRAGVMPNRLEKLDLETFERTVIDPDIPAVGDLAIFGGDVYVLGKVIAGATTVYKIGDPNPIIFTPQGVGTPTGLVAGEFNTVYVTYDSGVSYTLDLEARTARATIFSDPRLDGSGAITSDIGITGTSRTGTEGPDNLVGTSGPDVLIGLGGSDVLNGRSGDDQLFGGEGADRVEGSFGNDALFGGAGNDFMFGGSGDDGIFGGAGDDEIDGGNRR